MDNKVNLKINVKVYSEDPKTGERELINEGHNALALPGFTVFTHAAAGNTDFYISHMAGIFDRFSGATPGSTKYWTYADWIGALDVGILEEIPINLKSYRTHNPILIDNYQNNILELESTFTNPNTPVVGNTLYSAALLCKLPGGQTYMAAVYDDICVKPASRHLSFIWSIQFLGA